MRLSDDEIANCVRYVHAAFEQRSGIEVPLGAVNEITSDFIRMARQSPPLSSNERAILSLTKPKSAALLADRVWSMSDEADPHIAFGWEVPKDIRLRALFALYQVTVGNNDGSEAALDKTVHQATERFLNDIERDLANDFRESTGADVVPLYGSTARRDAQYHQGDEAAIIAVVENMDIIDEERLTWAQVIEFRRDKDARTAYRRFIHWLDKEMVGKPTGYIADEIADRLEQYEWALRKHGIQKVIGVLANTINPKSLISASSVGVAIEVIMKQPIWSLITTGGLIVGQTALSLVTTLLERRDIELAHREVAYVQEVKNRFES